MTDEQKQASSPGHPAVKTVLTMHGIGWTGVIVGSAVVGLSFLRPELTETVMQGFFGLLVTLLGGLGATRGGVKQEIAAQAPKLAQAAAPAVADAINESVDRLKDAVIEMNNGLSRMKSDIAKKHGETQGSHEELKKTLESLLDDRKLNEQLHKEHSARMDKLESEVKDVRDGHAEIMAKLESMSGAKDRAA